MGLDFSADLEADMHSPVCVAKNQQLLCRLCGHVSGETLQVLLSRH